MAFNMTQYLQKKLLDHTLGLTAYTMPTPVYLSLHIATPGETGSRANEVTTVGSNYARANLTAVMGATTLASGIAALGTTIEIGAATGADWGTITHIGVDDDLGAGDMLLYAASTTPQVINVGQTFRLLLGQLSIQFD